MRNKKKMVLVSLAIVVVFSLWQWLKPYPPQITLTEQEHNVVDNLLANPTPRCIGRYLVDLPEDFNTPIGTVYINKKEIESHRLYLPAFEQRIRLREEDLRKIKPLHTEDTPFLKNVYPLPNGMKGIIFETNSSRGSPDAFRNLEAHIYTNGVAFKTIIETVNPDGERYEKNRKKMPELYHNDVAIKLAELNKLLTRLHGRQENEIPTEKGFCFPNGFISGVSGVNDEMEDVRFSYRSKINPLLYIEFSTDNYLHEETSMLERSSTISSGLLNIQTTTLMKGRREINKLAAEEWLVVGNGEDSRSGHTFVLNVNEKIGSPQTPMFSIELNHGPLPDETLSQDAVVAFWQKITETLRVRPGAI